MSLLDPSFIDARLDSRAISFENPTGARGAGGTALVTDDAPRRGYL